MYIECQPVWQLVLFPSCLHCLLKLFLPHSSFNSNSVFLSDSLLLPTYSSFRLSLSLHVNYHLPPFLWHCSPSLTPSPFVSHHFLIPPSYMPLSSLQAKLPRVHLLSPLSFPFTLLTPLLSFASSSITPLPNAFLCFVCFCILSRRLKPYHSLFIFLQDLRRSCLFTSSVSPPSHRPSPHPTRSSFSPACSIFSPPIFIPAMSEWPESVSLHYSPSLLQLGNTFENQ